MKILLLSDIHGNVTAVSTVIRKITAHAMKIDLVLIAGDMPATTPIPLMLEFMVKHPLRAFSKTGYTQWVYGKGRARFLQYQKRSITKILNLLGVLDVPIVYIPGNVDCTEVKQTILDHSAVDIHFLDCTTILLNGIEIIGVGGSEFNGSRYSIPLCDGEYHPREYKDRTNTLLHHSAVAASSMKHLMRILITHEPPAFSCSGPSGVLRGGSSTVTQLINLLDPQITLFGHHHDIPLVKQVKNRIYVNPGPLARYYYALVDLSEDIPKVTLQRLSPPLRDAINLVYSISTYRRYNVVSPESVRFD